MRCMGPWQDTRGFPLDYAIIRCASFPFPKLLPHRQGRWIPKDVRGNVFWLLPDSLTREYSVQGACVSRSVSRGCFIVLGCICRIGQSSDELCTNKNWRKKSSEANEVGTDNAYKHFWINLILYGTSMYNLHSCSHLATLSGSWFTNTNFSRLLL